MSATINGGFVLPVAAQDVDQVVTVLREQVLALCAQASRAPSMVRVSMRDVVVEVEWTGNVEQVAEVPVAVAKPAEVPVARVNSVAPEVPVDSGTTFPLCAGTVGVFYRAPEPGAKSFVAEGDTIRPGQQVAILEAMKLMIPVEAERAGRVVEFLVEDGTPVEHGQPLLLLEPAA
jgi:acetyl-CoA carboxylase biotin carboxyl carrier protein